MKDQAPLHTLAVANMFDGQSDVRPDEIGRVARMCSMHALFNASKDGNAPYIDALLEHYNDDFNAFDAALMHLAEKYNAAPANDKEQVLADLTTAFYVAVRSQARWFCTYRYEYEDELDPIPDDGLTPLVWADDRTALTWADDGTTALMCASARGHAPCIYALLKHSPKEQVLSACCVSGTTALMCASASGHAPCIYALLTHCPKEQVLATDKRGMTALTIA